MRRGKRARPQSETIGSRGRKADGTFAPGNKLSRGNPHAQRIREYNEAIKTACSPADIKRLFRKIIAEANKGNLDAVKVVFERTLGKPSRTPPGGYHIDIELPELRSTADTVKASNAIMMAMSRGLIDPTSASHLANVVELARKSMETHELAERVARLEEEQNGG